MKRKTTAAITAGQQHETTQRICPNKQNHNRLKQIFDNQQKTHNVISNRTRNLFSTIELTQNFHLFMHYSVRSLGFRKNYKTNLIIISKLKFGKKIPLIY